MNEMSRNVRLPDITDGEVMPGNWMQFGGSELISAGISSGVWNLIMGGKYALIPTR